MFLNFAVAPFKRGSQDVIMIDDTIQTAIASQELENYDDNIVDDDQADDDDESIQMDEDGAGDDDHGDENDGDF